MPPPPSPRSRPARNRLKQLSSDGSTKYYLNDSISGIMQEKVIGASLAVSWNDYIMVGGEMVAQHVTQASPTTRCFHKDHLGSIVALTNEAGSVVERDSFDAWGERRVPTELDDLTRRRYSSARLGCRPA